MVRPLNDDDWPCPKCGRPVRADGSCTMDCDPSVGQTHFLVPLADLRRLNLLASRQRLVEAELQCAEWPR